MNLSRKKRTLFTLLVSVQVLTFLVWLGCGNEKSKMIEAAEQRAHDDSIRKATEELITMKLEKKQALNDSVNAYTQKLKELREKLRQDEIELEVQKDKLLQIKEFQWFRTKAEREQQIRDQMRLITDLEEEIQRLRNQILELEIKQENFRRELLALQ